MSLTRKDIRIPVELQRSVERDTGIRYRKPDLCEDAVVLLAVSSTISRHGIYFLCIVPDMFLFTGALHGSRARSKRWDKQRTVPHDRRETRCAVLQLSLLCFHKPL